MNQNITFATMTNPSYFILPEAVGWFQRVAGHTVERAIGVLDTFNMHFVTEGKGYVELNGNTYTLNKGDAFLFFPREHQKYYSSKEDPWSIRFLHFYGDHLPSFLMERGFHRSNLWTIKQPKALEETMQELLTEAETSKLLQMDRLSVLSYAVLTTFILNATPQTAGKGVDPTDRIVKLLPAIQESACHPFILEDWAHKAMVTPHYFCKLFKKATQMTPMTFVTLCRIQLAKQRLVENKHRPIREIAEEAGYPSVSYFNKKFVEHEGMTPTAYRNLL